LPNVLLGRLAGDKIADMEKLTDGEIIKSCGMIFDKFLPNIKRGRIVDLKTSKWKTSPNFGGTYSYYPINDNSPQILAKPLLDASGKPRVLFAGEATHDYFFSTVHGAIESGYREAERLNKLYRI
jgi:spermine oxidase